MSNLTIRIKAKISRPTLRSLQGKSTTTHSCAWNPRMWPYRHFHSMYDLTEAQCGYFV